MYQQGVIKRSWYLWYVSEWRSKTLAFGVIVLVLLGVWWGFPRTRTPENAVCYYLWRLRKTNGTQYDRYRAREKLSALLRAPEPAAVRALSERVTSLLRYEAPPPETAESLLSVLVEHRAVADKHGSSLGPGLAQSLRTSNPDIRSRIQKALVLLAADRKKVLPDDLKGWSPSKQDSLQELEDRIQQWSALWASP